MPVGAGENKGYIDNLYVAPSGAIVAIETKLFRNQESKRLVVAQIIEYAKELQKWDCGMLDKVAINYTKRMTKKLARLIDIMVEKGYLSYSNEAQFIDKINENLKKAKFLLLIIGDGIRTGVEQMVEFLNSFSAMSFNLALVEMEIYSKGEDTIVIPNILNKTSVVDLYYSQPVNQITQSVNTLEKTKYISKPILSRKEFIEKFADNGKYDSAIIEDFINNIDALNGIVVEMRPTELHIRFNSSISKTHVLVTFSIASSKADVWIQPQEIKDELNRIGVSNKPYDDFLEFYKDYIDVPRCKYAPYINEKGFYFANVYKILSNTDAFIKGCEAFASSVAAEQL